MKKFTGLILCLCLFSILCPAAWSKDFGLILDQNAGLGGVGANPDFTYSAILIPRFSTFIKDRGEFYVSAGLKVDYNKSWAFIPELLRTEFSWEFNSGFLQVGRIHYADPFGYIADGLFDGAKYTFDTKIGTLSGGLWYTGLQYKKRANIAMTVDEMQKLNTTLNYRDFYSTYFSPSRLLASFYWEHPGLGERVGLKLALLGQFDLTGKRTHSQYLSASAFIPFKTFFLNFGGCLEFAEITGDFYISLAGEAAAAFDIPTAIEDELSVVFSYSGGRIGNSPFMSFLPLTSKTRGEVIKAPFAGITVLSLDYLARIHRTFSAGISSSYFIRNDLATMPQYGNSGHMLGNEFHTRLMWSPLSDIQLNFGGGIFLPALGNADRKAGVVWRFDLNLILSLY